MSIWWLYFGNNSSSTVPMMRFDYLENYQNSDGNIKNQAYNLKCTKCDFWRHFYSLVLFLLLYEVKNFLYEWLTIILFATLVRIGILTPRKTFLWMRFASLVSSKWMLDKGSSHIYMQYIFCQSENIHLWIRNQKQTFSVTVRNIPPQLQIVGWFYAKSHSWCWPARRVRKSKTPWYPRSQPLGFVEEFFWICGRNFLDLLTIFLDLSRIFLDFSRKFFGLL